MTPYIDDSMLEILKSAAFMYLKGTSNGNVTITATGPRARFALQLMDIDFLNLLSVNTYRITNKGLCYLRDHTDGDSGAYMLDRIQSEISGKELLP